MAVIFRKEAGPGQIGCHWWVLVLILVQALKPQGINESISMSILCPQDTLPPQQAVGSLALKPLSLRLLPLF
jgi:hypothetical protein